jgi:hypothetical protein
MYPTTKPKKAPPIIARKIPKIGGKPKVVYRIEDT